MADDLKESDILADALELEQENGVAKENLEPLINPEQQAELDQEMELEDKYGDKDLRTFAESAASGATFGLSDQALVASGVVTKEELRERRKRNSEAALAGEIAGVVGPALISGGSSVLAKGIGAGVKTAAKAGNIVEKLTAKGINKLLSETGKKELAKSVLKKSIAKGAGSAVEGSFYGAGKLISEEALGNADFNAENFIAHAGTGALLGGLVGGTFGAIEAVVPVIKGDKITGWVSKKIKGTLDPAKNAQQLAGVSPSKIYKMKTFSPELYAHTPKMLKEIASKKGVKTFSSNEKLFRTVKEFIEETGNDIGKSLDDISEVLTVKGQLPKRSQVAQRIVNKLDELTNQFKDADGKSLAGALDKVRKINRVKAQFDKDLLNNKIMTTKEINVLKSKYQKLAKWDRKGMLPLEESINRNISRALRDEVMDLAEKAGGDLGNNLKREMLNYGSATEFAENFGQKIDKQKLTDFLSIRDVLLGGVFGGAGKVFAAANIFSKTDLKKKLAILAGIEKANLATGKKISSKVSNFLKGVKRVKTPVLTKSLLESKFSYKQKPGQSSEKPKNKKEAFDNMRENIYQVATDPEKLYDVVTTNDMEYAAPKAAAQSIETISKAVQFLHSKLPISSAPQGMFSQKTWEPSSIEVFKFEQYLEAIQNPLSILDDLENGYISRDSVEAIKSVYPNLYTRIQQTVIEKIVKDPDKVDYKKRLQLGTLLDIPVDASLNPDYILKMQQHFKEAQQSQTGGAISANRASKVDMAESQATEVQKVSNRSDLK